MVNVLTSRKELIKSPEKIKEQLYDQIMHLANQALYGEIFSDYKCLRIRIDIQKVDNRGYV